MDVVLVIVHEACEHIAEESDSEDEEAATRRIIQQVIFYFRVVDKSVGSWLHF